MAAELIKCSPEQFETFRAELNEFDDEKILENMKKIQDWYQTQAHLPQNYDKRIVFRFLRGCKHDLERVKRKLNIYFLLRSETPEFYSNRSPSDPDFKLVLDECIAYPLPTTTADGFRVSYFDISDAFDIVAVFKLILMVSDIRLLEEENIRGDVFIFDVQKVNAKLLAKLMSPYTKKVLMAAQEAYPQRLNSIHLINTNLFAEKCVNLIKMFLKSAMKKRFHCHSRLDTLYEHVDRACLPQELGGDSVSVAKLQAGWKEKLESYMPYFAEQEKIHTDRDKVVGKEDFIRSDSFGVEGNFRQLKID